MLSRESHVVLGLQCLGLNWLSDDAKWGMWEVKWVAFGGLFAIGNNLHFLFFHLIFTGKSKLAEQPFSER